jgi:type I restriction enzyme S subunit
VTDLPREWSSTTLGEIAETKLGKMLSAKARNGHGRPYLRNKNVQWGRIDTNDLLRMDFSDEEFERFRLREGDLLVCEGGEVGRAAIWRAPIGECAYQKALHRVRPVAGVMPEYLLYLLRHYGDARFFEQYVTGSTIAHLPQEDLRELPIPLPPLAEQRRIVAAIEEQLSRLDAAVATLRAVQLRAVLARRALLAAVFSSYPSRVPLLEVADPQRPICYGILKPRTTGDLVVPYVEVRSIQDGRIDLDSLHRTTLALHREFARSTLASGDVVIAVRGSWDRAAVVPVGLEGANLSRDVARVAPLPEMNPQFLSCFLGSPAAGAYFASVARGVGVRGVNIGDLRRLPVPCPTLDEQAAAVERIEVGLSAIEAARQSATTGTRRAESLRRSILASAFRGELVPQDPHDEPASVLLERIAAELGAAPKPARKRREKSPA